VTNICLVKYLNKQVVGYISISVDAFGFYIPNELVDVQQTDYLIARPYLIVVNPGSLQRLAMRDWFKH